MPVQFLAPRLLICPATSLSGAAPATPAGSGLPPLVFARQFLPAAQSVSVDSIRAGAEVVFAAITASLPDRQSWLLHVAAHYGAANAGEHRCRLIRESVLDRLQRQRRGLRRALAPDTAPLTTAHSVVQLLLIAPDRGLLSLAVAPRPFQWRRVLAPFPKGWVQPARDLAAPCRAFAKLVEAEARLGRRIAAGETCVDLGACPGSWSYVALGRGARVCAVDRSPLRADLMAHPRLHFVRGDAFRFVPDEPVDWLLCDVIAAPERSMELLQTWVVRRWARHFVVTLKFKGAGGYAELDGLKRALPPLTSEFFLLHLCANRNEVCAFGSIAPPPGDDGAPATNAPPVSASSSARG